MQLVLAGTTFCSGQFGTDGGSAVTSGPFFFISVSDG